MDRIVVPESMKRWTVDCHWESIKIGESVAEVYLLEHVSANNRFLKRQPSRQRESLATEKEKLDWLKGKLPVPEVLGFDIEDGYEYLLTSEVEGRNAADPAICRDPKQFVTLLAQGLRSIHGVDIEQCPFDERLPVKLAEAGYRLRNRLVEEDDFDAERQGISADGLYMELIATQPCDEEDLVFTHGDYCMPNIVIKDEEISGFIDWGRAGISDRYQDLALAARSIVRNYGEPWVSVFYEAYGIDPIGESKVSFYQLLDEFY